MIYLYYKALSLLVVVFLIGSCSDPSTSDLSGTPYTPYAPASTTAQGLWADVLQNDPDYPDNVYLTEFIEFHPGQVGLARRSDTVHYDSNGYPLQNLGALGPPEGCYPSTFSNPDATMTVLGQNGWGIWQFNPDYRIINGDGPDFTTFANHNVFTGDPDESWNELGRVYVSIDGIDWYRNSAELYTVHPDPGENNNNYDWDAVSGLHGNTHTWVNFRLEVQAEWRDPATGRYALLENADGSPFIISRYFTPDEHHLGGDSFDLTDFVHTDTGVPWPADGQMSYLKIVDDPAILDGQDWNNDWMTGARLIAAMGIHVEYVGAP